MKTILLPTDFSNNSLLACQFAITQLKEPETKFILNYVYDIPRGGTSGLFYLMEELHKQGEQDLNDFKSRLINEFESESLNIETRLNQGIFADQTARIAKEVEADCIVMGTKGSTGLKEVLIGSNALALMKETTKPLYIIPESYREYTLDKIIVAFDGKEMNVETVKVASAFAKKHQLPVEVLHVRLDEESPLQDWDVIKELFGDIKIDIHESWGENLEDGLKKGIEGSNALMVMTLHKKTFWERFFNISDSRDVVMQAQLPVLVVPE